MTVESLTPERGSAVQSTPRHITRLWGHLLPRRKKQLAVLSLLIMVTSFAEVFAIGAVLPFLGVLTAPEKIFTHELALHNGISVCRPCAYSFVMGANPPIYGHWCRL